ncbi:GNAT family N-acetyltransferase [Micromonospora halophytica]|uniref:Acetyltransferase (GNAT) family protein n=1 Tax=Micromonospora halophytica TaxID=47864 RepID=A0A1C5INY8_9ACTN|nr:GNAT family N-acetyltransferase [Micromonospora halophytica]SCG60015.1 Acetyltransferase (GNAT) family protein [Micromonospora halophytica]
MLLRTSQPADYQQMADILYGMGHDQEGWDYQYAAEGGPDPSLPSWVAVDGNEVLGLVEGRFDSTYDERIEQPDHPLPHAWIYLIGVRPDAQRKGIGTALVRYFAEQAALAGCSFVALSPDQSDDDVMKRVAFFRSCGLAPLINGDPEDVHGAPLAELLSHLR